MAGDKATKKKVQWIIRYYTMNGKWKTVLDSDLFIGGKPEPFIWTRYKSATRIAELFKRNIQGVNKTYVRLFEDSP